MRPTRKTRRTFGGSKCNQSVPERTSTLVINRIQVSKRQQKVSRTSVERSVTKAESFSRSFTKKTTLSLSKMRNGRTVCRRFSVRRSRSCDGQAFLAERFSGPRLVGKRLARGLLNHTTWKNVYSRKEFLRRFARNEELPSKLPSRRRRPRSRSSTAFLRATVALPVGEIATTVVPNLRRNRPRRNRIRRYNFQVPGEPKDVVCEQDDRTSEAEAR